MEPHGGEHRGSERQAGHSGHSNGAGDMPRPASLAVPEPLGVLGATSFIGRRLLDSVGDLACAAAGDISCAAAGDMACAAAGDARLHAFTRGPLPPPARRQGAAWHLLGPAAPPGLSTPRVVALCPLWAVPAHFPLLEALGCRRLVALSSTSRFTKRAAVDPAERDLAARLESAEEAILRWAADRGVAATLLRPTLVYDGRADENVARIARVIRRSGWFAVVGRAAGLRQPVHVADVAAAAIAALSAATPRPAYELSGGETLPYREMVRRVFAWLGLPPRILTVPASLVRGAVPLVAWSRRLTSLASVGLRMNDDLVFDHAAATADLGFRPRPFALPSPAAPDHARSIPRDHRPA